VPRQVQCPCGNAFTVRTELAGGQVGCPLCGRVLSVPRSRPPAPRAEETRPLDLELERDEEPLRVVGLPERPAEEDRDDQRPIPVSKKLGQCYLCGEVARGKMYHFLAAFFGGQTRTPGYRGEYIEIRTTYHDLARHGIFLCRACAVAVWRKNYILLASLFAGGGLVLFVLALVVGLSNTQGAGGFAGVLLFFLVLVLGVALFLLWKAMHNELDRDTMESLVIRLVRRDFSDAGDTFFTTEQARRKFRS